MCTSIKALMGSVEINIKNFPQILKSELCLALQMTCEELFSFSKINN